MTSFDRWAVGLTLPAVLITVLFYIVPIGQVLTLSVTEPAVGLDNYRQLLSSGAVLRVVKTTLTVSLWTTAVSVLASYVVAFALLQMRPGLRRIAMLMVLVPFWISVLVRAFSWITILRRQGLVNTALIDAGVIAAPLDLVHNRLGVMIGMVHYMMPFAVLLIFANLSGIDRRIALAARSLGAQPMTVFWRIWVPLSAPGVAVATLFVFIFSLGFLITPALLGAGRTVMVAEYISVQITNTLRWGIATGLSTLLLLAVGLLVLVVMRQPAMRAAFQGEGRLMRRVAAAIAGQSLAWILLAFLFLPVLVVVPVALTDREYLSLPEHALSLRHVASVASWETGWLSSILTSLAIATIASIVSVAAAAAYSIGAWALTGWWPSLSRIVLLAPLIVPPIVYAVGIFKMWAAFDLLDSYTGVIIVHVVLCLPFSILAIGASLSHLDPRLIQAARSLGARPPTVFRRIVLPGVVPGLAAGAVFAFITSWDEITVTLFITSRDVVTLPRRIWTSIADNLDPALAVIATLVLVVTLVGVVVHTLSERRAAGTPH